MALKRGVGALGLLALCALSALAIPAHALNQTSSAHEVYEEGDFRVMYKAPWKKGLLEKALPFPKVTHGFDGGVVEWYYNDANRPVGYASADEAIAALQSGMQQWQTVCNITFLYKGQTSDLPGIALGTGSDGRNTIGWHDPDHQYYAGVGGVASLNGRVIEGDIWLSSRYVASAKTIAHELGHMLGFDHSKNEGAVMSGPPGASYTTNSSLPLQPDDIEGCKNLYGLRASGTVLPKVVPVGGNFGGVTENTDSAPLSVRLTNEGTASLDLAQAPSVTVPFSIEATGTTCEAGTTLAQNASCDVQVVFRPTALGSVTGELKFKHNGNPTETVIPLTGVGIAAAQPVVELAPDPVDFLVQELNTSAEKTVTVRNTGGAALNLTAIKTVSPPFEVLDSGTCSVGTPVPASGECTVKVRYTPTSAGKHDAFLRLEHNSPSGSTELALTGRGVAPATPSVALERSELDFSGVDVDTSSNKLSLTVKNVGSAKLILNADPVVNGPFELILPGTTCTNGTELAKNATCVFELVFKPTTAGQANGVLEIHHNAAGNPSTVALKGVGVALTPAAHLQPTTLDFGTDTVVGTTSSDQTVTLTNKGKAVLRLTKAPEVNGPFELASGGTCAVNVDIAVNDSCTLLLAFKPSNANTANGTLTLEHNANPNMSTVQLRGKGKAAPVATPKVSHSSLEYGVFEAGNSSAPSSVTLRNDGTASMTLSAAPDLIGLHAASFELVTAGTTCKAGSILAPGDSCVVKVVFKPQAAGIQEAQLRFQHDAAGGETLVHLRGGIVTAPTPVPVLTPLLLLLLSIGLGIVGATVTRRRLSA
ncbi:choice-of-anchor D domain-containing protein [Allofranklinella schreckenbergeri]|nr:choice-of-anchor D domain-containing protein [Allofranklinella schreckenbergeri]